MIKYFRIFDDVIRFYIDFKGARNTFLYNDLLCNATWSVTRVLHNVVRRHKRKRFKFLFESQFPNYCYLWTFVTFSRLT